MEYYKEVIKKYAVFKGRARRKEYWMFGLFNFIISIGLTIIGYTLGLTIGSGDNKVEILSTIYTLFVLIPSLAVSIRRLHDTNRSGWWLLIALIPIVGAIVLIVFALLDSTPGHNKYGPNPKGVPGTSGTSPLQTV